MRKWFIVVAALVGAISGFTPVAQAQDSTPCAGTTVKSLAVSSQTGEIAVERDWGRDIEIWSANGARVDKQFPTVGHRNIVESVAYSPDGKTVLTGGFDGAVILWDVQSGKLLHFFEGDNDFVYSTIFSPDGKTILTGSADRTAKLWDLQTGTLIHTLQGHTDVVNHVAFSPDGKTVLTGGSDDTARLWDVQTGVLLHTLQVQSTGDSFYYSAVFAPDGKTVLTTNSDRTAKVWDVQSGAFLFTLQL